MLSTLEKLLRTGVNGALRLVGLKLVWAEPFRHRYINAPRTIRAAKAAGVSVSEYVQTVLFSSGETVRETVDNMRRVSALTADTKTICEIGPGTGQYIEAALRYCHPERYEIYEPHQGWASWLARNYPVLKRFSDGQTLTATSDSSMELVMAHGVFSSSYLSFLTTMSYFREMVRVTAPGGYVVFDICSEQCYSPADVDAWLASNDKYATFLGAQYTRDCFTSAGFELVSEFIAGCGRLRTHYFIFRKARGASRQSSAA